MWTKTKDRLPDNNVSCIVLCKYGITLPEHAEELNCYFAEYDAESKSFTVKSTIPAYVGLKFPEYWMLIPEIP